MSSRPIDPTKLFFALVKRGFKARRHAADFFVRWHDKFVCVFTILPNEGRVMIYPTRWNPESPKAIEVIVELIRSLKEDIDIMFLG